MDSVFDNELGGYGPYHPSGAGRTIVTFTLGYCFLAVIALPVFAVVRERYKRLKQELHQGDSAHSEFTVLVNDRVEDDESSTSGEIQAADTQEQSMEVVDLTDDLEGVEMALISRTKPKMSTSTGKKTPSQELSVPIFALTLSEPSSPLPAPPSTKSYMAYPPPNDSPESGKKSYSTASITVDSSDESVSSEASSVSTSAGPEEAQILKQKSRPVLRFDSRSRALLSSIFSKLSRRISTTSSAAETIIAGDLESKLTSVVDTDETDCIQFVDVVPARLISNGATHSHHQQQLQPQIQDCPQIQDDYPVTILFGPRAIWRPSELLRGFDYLVYLAQFDEENKSLLILAAPLVSSYVVSAVFDNMTYALIGTHMGSHAIAAYAIVGTVIGFFNTFVTGLPSAFWTIGSHAIGAKNYFLAGQYVQICAIFYALYTIPLYIIWFHYMEDVILAFGLSAEVAKMGCDYTKVLVFYYLMKGVTISLLYLLEITKHEYFCSIMGIFEGLFDVMAIGLMVYFFPETTTLVTIGYIYLVVGTSFAVATFGIAYSLGWLELYLNGICRSFALKNTHAVKTLIWTAVPLSFGSVLEYGEWQVLTLIATSVGPAEVAAWAVLGSLWGTFEAATKGVVGAASVRVALHLGSGNPVMAKVSSYKGLLFGSVVALTLTAIFFIIGPELASLFTDDITLQTLMNDALPLIGVGNVTLAFGSMSWTLIGTQGRYKLATITSAITSWGLTLPMACALVFRYKLGLEAIVSSVVVGYVTSCTALACVLLSSDWDKIAKVIQEQNTAGKANSNSDKHSDDKPMEGEKGAIDLEAQ